MSERLAAQLRILQTTVADRAGADPATSYTARLLAEGPARAAQKLGEEAVELAIAATRGDARAVAEESADLLYHWLVLLAACEVTTDAVADAVAARQGRSGLAERAGRARR